MAFRPGLAQIRAQFKSSDVRTPVLDTKIGHTRGIVVATRPLSDRHRRRLRTFFHVATPQGAYPPRESVAHLHVLLHQHHCQLRYQNCYDEVAHPDGMHKSVCGGTLTKLGFEVDHNVLRPETVRKCNALRKKPHVSMYL